MTLQLTTLCDHFRAADSRRRIVKTHDGLVRREAVGPVLVPVDAGGTTTPVSMEKARPAFAAGLKPTPAVGGHGLEGHEDE